MSPSNEPPPRDAHQPAALSHRLHQVPARRRLPAPPLPRLEPVRGASQRLPALRPPSLRLATGRRNSSSTWPPVDRWASHAGRQHFGVVEDQGVSRPQDLRQLREDPMLPASVRRQAQQPARVTGLHGLLGDQFFGDGEIELLEAHGRHRPRAESAAVALPFRHQAAAVLLPVDAPLTGQAARFSVERAAGPRTGTPRRDEPRPPDLFPGWRRGPGRG